MNLPAQFSFGEDKVHIRVPSVEGSLGWPQDLIQHKEHAVDTAFSAMIKTALTSFIGRIILALFSLVVVPILPALINFANDILGYGLTDAQVTSYAKNAALGVAALAATWLLNRGRFEAAAVAAKGVIEAGKANSNLLERSEHAPGEFEELPLDEAEAQRAGFKAGTARPEDPVVPPGISRKE